ncbi:hypothetical protein [Pseudomonas sivasensis]|uniref:hypothetical protein n=1 Tax=Pseudomonas sivasensis TaxID=1880678 RepID=UPI003BA23C94
MNTITMTEINELARQTGNTSMAVLTDLIERGYQLVEKPPAPRGNPLTSSKDALAQWKASKQKARDELYKADPLIRQLTDLDTAYNSSAQQAKQSIVQRDAFGNITGTTKSVLTGATQKEQAELMAAIRAMYNQGE